MKVPSSSSEFYVNTTDKLAVNSDSGYDNSSESSLKSSDSRTEGNTKPRIILKLRAADCDRDEYFKARNVAQYEENVENDPTKPQPKIVLEQCNKNGQQTTKKLPKRALKSRNSILRDGGRNSESQDRNGTPERNSRRSSSKALGIGVQVGRAVASKRKSSAPELSSNEDVLRSAKRVKCSPAVSTEVPIPVTESRSAEMKLADNPNVKPANDKTSTETLVIKINGAHNGNSLKWPKLKRRRRYFKGLSYSFGHRSRKHRWQKIHSKRKVPSHLKICAEHQEESSATPKDEAVYIHKKLNTAKAIHKGSVVQTCITEPSGISIALDVRVNETACFCQKGEQLFVRSTELDVMYCQAINTVHDRHVGCCNTVTSKDIIKLWRPSSGIPFLMFCDAHVHRLLLHNCCPTCGLFCTLGQFKLCTNYHLFHKSCELVIDGKLLCPHCGSDKPLWNVQVVLGEHRNPVYLSQQTPQKDTPSARISISRHRVEENKCEHPPPSPQILRNTSSNNLEMSLNGLLSITDKDKLEQYLSNIMSERSVNSTSIRYTYRAFYAAAKHGDIEKLLACLSVGLNPNHGIREFNMGTALHAAALSGSVSAIHLLLQAGAQINMLDKELNTALMLAMSNKHINAVKYLVKAGANVNMKGKDGMTVMHLAAQTGDVEVCRFILSNLTNSFMYVNSTDDGGWTPLVWAAEHKHVDVVRYLLTNYADPLILDTEENTALHWSSYSGSTDICSLLMDYGCSANVVNIHGDTPLHICARQEWYSCTMLLLARGADTSIKNKNGFLPVDCCINKDSDACKVIRINMQLKELGANCRGGKTRILTNDISKGYEKYPIQCLNSVDDEEQPNDFTYVTQNCFTSNISVNRNIADLESCECDDRCSSTSCACAQLSIKCWYTDDGKLSDDLNIKDPPTLFECNYSCKCNKLKCKNRVVQNGSLARVELFRTKGRGWGLRTLRDITKGSFVCEYVGEIISDTEADTREHDSYIFDLENRDGETYCIDAFRYGNIARFINHNCNPNLMPVRVFTDHQDLHFPRIAFFASRDIPAYEELGYDYGEKFWMIKYKMFTCTCNAESCRYSKSTIQNTLEEYKERQSKDSTCL